MKGNKDLISDELLFFCLMPASTFQLIFFIIEVIFHCSIFEG